MKNYKIVLLVLSFFSACILFGCSARKSSPDISWNDISSSFEENEGSMILEPKYSTEIEADPVETFSTDSFLEGNFENAPTIDLKVEPIEPVSPDRMLISDGFKANVQALSEEKNNATIQSRTYTAVNNISYQMMRVNQIKSSVCVFRKTIADEAIMRYYDSESAAWMKTEMIEGRFDCSLIDIEIERGESLLIQTPRCYLPHENHTIEYLPDYDGIVQIKKMNEGWSLSVWCNCAPKDSFCDVSVLSSPRTMFDWTGENLATLWSAYANGSVAWWCFDGYYRSVPTTYIPTGENYYYCCAASYLPSTFLAKPTLCKTAPVLLVAMLDTVALNQNEYGFWETSPESTWLSTNYAVGNSFYDSRFNTDLMNLYFSADALLGDGLFSEAEQRYMNYYYQIAMTYHWNTENGGWMVEDYWCEKPHLHTHTSLNHLVSECLLAYKWADKTGSTKYRLLADNLLQAIIDTSFSWIKENNDFYYCIFPDGSFDTLSEDYAHLTYDDLYQLRDYLNQKEDKTDSVNIITEMLNAKRKWMDKNGVQNYIQE